MKAYRKLIYRILIILLVAALVYIFALDEDRSTLEWIRYTLRAAVRAL